MTESGYCRKLMELKEEEGWNISDLNLLRVGRHFRIHPGARVVSGRNDGENRELIKLAEDNDYLFQATLRPGSLVMLRCRGEYDPGDLAAAAAVCARYSKEKEKALFEIDYWRGGEREDVRRIPASPMGEDDLNGLRI